MRADKTLDEVKKLFLQAKQRRAAALRAFEYADDPILVEAAIYELRVANADMGYALKLARAKAAQS